MKTIDNNFMCHYHLPLPVISATLSQFHSERSVVYHVDGQQGAKSHTVSTSSQQLSLFSSQQTITDDRLCVSPSQTAPFVLCLQEPIPACRLKMFVGDKSSSGSTVKWQTAERLEGQESGRGHPAWQQERDKGHLFKHEDYTHVSVCSQAAA